MSLIKSIRKQLGLSVTPANNFTLDASADNGTMKLARGNAGATTQDIMTVDASGKVEFTSGLLGFNFSLAADGYIQFPSWCFGGFIIQWGTSTGGNPATTETFAIPFPTACYAVTHACVDASGNALRMAVVNGIAVNSFTWSGYAAVAGSALTANNGISIRYIAVGK